MNFTISLLQKVDQVTLGYTAQAYQAVVAAHMGELRLTLVIYFALYGLAVLQGWVPLTMKDIAKHALKAMLIFSIATNWGYFSTFVYKVFTQGPDKLMSALIGGSKPSEQLAAVYEQGMEAGTKIGNNAGKLDVAMILVGLIVMLLTLIMSAYALFLLILAKIGLAVLLALGPIFITLALFNVTRGLFQSWLHYLINYALIPVITLSVLGLIVSILKEASSDLGQITDWRIAYLFPYLLTCAITILLLSQVTRVASSLGNGIALSTAGAFGSLMRMPSKGIRKLQSRGKSKGSAEVNVSAQKATQSSPSLYARAAGLYRRARSFGVSDGRQGLYSPKDKS